MSNQQQGARQIRSNTNLFVSCVPKRPLALDRQTTAATESGATSTTQHAMHTADISPKSLLGKKKSSKRCDTGTNACHWFLPWMLSTYYDLRGAQLNSRRNGFPS